MSSARRQFDNSIALLCNIDAIYGYINKNAPSMDASSLLRSEFVLIVSAFDTYVHELVNEKIVFNFFSSQLAIDIKLLISIHTVRSILNETDAFTQRQLLSSELKKIMSKHSYQSPSSVEYALSLIGLKKVWSALSISFGKSGSDIRDTLALIVNRRNKIAHESDIDPTTGLASHIDRETVNNCVDFVTRLVHEIDSIT